MGIEGAATDCEIGEYSIRIGHLLSVSQRKYSVFVGNQLATFGWGFAPNNAMIHFRMMATTARAIPVSESLLRREAVDNALADLRLEGLAPSAAVQALFLQFIDGDLTESELLHSVLSR